MSSFILPSRFNQQPQQAAPLDPSNALGAKVIECMPLDGSRATLVSRAVITYGAGGSIQVSVKGRGLRGAGAGARASVPLALANVSKLSVAFWLYWDAFANDDALGFELGTNSSQPNSGAFGFDPNSSGGRIEIFGAYSNTGVFSSSFARPSAGAWHRYVLTFDGSTLPQLAIDGIYQVASVALNPGGTGSGFRNDVLYLLSRANSSLLATGNLQDLTFYAGALSANEVAQDYQNPWQIFKATPRRLFANIAAGSGVSVVAGNGALTLTGYSPTIARSANQSVVPLASSVAVTGYAPTVAQSSAATINTGAGSIAIAGYAPTVARTANQFVTPPVGALSITGYAPTVAQLPVGTIAPQAGSVAITGYAPNVLRTANASITLVAGQISITGYAPTIFQGAAGATPQLNLYTIMRQPQINLTAPMGQSLNLTARML